MKAVRIHEFGPPEVLSLEEVPEPKPGSGEVLVQVSAAGVGPWDALIRSGRSALPQPLPLTLGSDLSGVIGAVGPGVGILKLAITFSAPPTSILPEPTRSTRSLTRA